MLLGHASKHASSISFRLSAAEFIKCKLEGISNFEKDKVIKLGSIVGISNDNGKSWKFVNGLAFNKLFPDVAGMIPIPNEKSFVNFFLCIMNHESSLA